MSTTILSYPARGGSGGLEITGRTVVTVLIAWLALVVLLGASGHFVSPPRIPPWPIALGAGCRSWRSSRCCVTRALSVPSCWRSICASSPPCRPGAGPASNFSRSTRTESCRRVAWPAGLGDMIVGFSAPAVVLALARNPAFAGSRAFARWNVFGILDLAVALGVGTLASLRASGAPGEVTTAPMAYMPLVLIPAFLVPFFIMLHAAALLQGRQVRAGGGGAP